MVRLTPKIPAAVSPMPPEVVINDEDWRRIEVNYGHHLSPLVKRDIHAVTVSLVQVATLELFAEPASTARTRIKTVQKTASSFVRKIANHPKSYARLYADMLVEMEFSDKRIVGNRKLKELVELIDALSASCVSALARLDDLVVTSPRKGSGWGMWVRRLTEIVKENDLPVGVRKDPAKQSQSRPPSPFVALVRELQLCLPREYRRATHSDDALAGEISVVRRATAGRKRHPRVSG